MRRSVAVGDDGQGGADDHLGEHEQVGPQARGGAGVGVRRLRGA